MELTREVRLRQAVEHRIVRQVVRDALKAGYTISVDNGGDEFEIKNSTDFKSIIKTMFATDDEHIYLQRDGRQGWVYFVYGNDGWDVVCNYTVNIEDVLTEANAMAERYQ